MNNLEVGQVLSLKIRFNNEGLISNARHPYLVVDINSNLGFVEIAQLDSLQGKEYKALKASNKTIFCDEPVETVIDKDSYIQLDNTFRLENCHELSQFRRQEDKLSDKKLSEAIIAYKGYHDKYEIDENKNVYMDKSEILMLNR